MTSKRAEKIVIVGGGLVGLTTALALSKSNYDVTLCAPDFDSNTQMDGRSTALLAHSVEYLKKMDIWHDLIPHAFPLKIMRLIDDTERLIRAPQVDFKSSEIDLDAFGYNVLNHEFSKILAEKIKQAGNIKLTNQLAKTVIPPQADDSVTKIILENGSEITADLVLACDGRNSLTRNSYGIELDIKPYPQVAVVGNVEHTLSHNDTSTEFHTPSGPFTLVPMGNSLSSFVCVVDGETANRLLQYSSSEIDLEIERRSHSVLGKTKLITDLQKFPLSTSNNNIYSDRNLILLGEAAHVLPPIGAQGFNIGIRDIEAIELLLLNEDLGVSDIIASYQRSRLLDVKSRSASVDLFNRSLLSDFLPVQLARSFGLYALGTVSPLRKLAMKEGVEPGRGFAQLFKRNLPHQTKQ